MCFLLSGISTSLFFIFRPIIASFFDQQIVWANVFPMKTWFPSKKWVSMIVFSTKHNCNVGSITSGFSRVTGYKIFKTPDNPFSNEEKRSSRICRIVPFIYRLTGMYVLNICLLCHQSIFSRHGPLRRRHIFLVKHIRFPTIQRPRGRTFRWIHRPTDLLNLPDTSPCLPLWVQRKPWSCGSMNHKPFYNWIGRQLVLQLALVALLESHLKTVFQILRKHWIILFQYNKGWMSESDVIPSGNKLLSSTW